MYKAELYQKSNSLQKRDALEVLKEHSRRIKWKICHNRVVDIGCGDGSVTADILKAHIPDSHFELVGCDISADMVQYANEHYRDEQTSFTVQDIEGVLDNEFVGEFDHAFSFYALHWIRDQEKAFTNIYELLDEGGDCLLVFLGHMPVFDVYRIMAERAKWREWMRDVDRFVSPYHDSQEPEKEIKRMMERIGFSNVDVQCREMVYVFDNIELLKKAVIAVNPFNIPKELHEDFLTDYLDVVRDMRLMDEANNNIGEEDVTVRAQYDLIVTYATK